MLSWSLNFIRRMIGADGESIIFPSYVMAGLVVASLNMLVQVFLSAAFGDKSVLKIGGKR